MLPKVPPATHTTHIGHVDGPVHTGSGDLNVQTTVSIEVLVQKLETALTAAGVPADQKKSILAKVGDVVRELGTDVAAKIAVELMKP